MTVFRGEFSPFRMSVRFRTWVSCALVMPAWLSAVRPEARKAITRAPFRLVALHLRERIQGGGRQRADGKKRRPCYLFRRGT